MVKKFRLFLNERYEYLFVSNPNINAEKIVCVESGFDAMAYHELHGCPKIFYISMSGHIDERKLEQFLQWNRTVDPSHTLPLLLAFDHDIEGMRYDLILLSHWINRKSNRVFIETDWKRPVMRLKLNYLSKSIAIMERDTNYINERISRGSHGMPEGLLKAICYRDKVLWELDLEKMNSAAAILKEYSDFQCFSRSRTDVRTYICQIFHAEWKMEKNKLVFHISADRFLRNMVRAIVGTLVEIGQRKLPVAAMHEIIKSKDRAKAGASVPAHGLYLTKIEYPETIRIN